MASDAVLVRQVGVVIPAHNEAGTIGRCLESLGDPPVAGQVIVVCNGCTDDTADRARQAGGERVCVQVTELASKTHALNVGDAAITGFPRFYIDADVRLDKAALAKMTAALERPGVLAVAPRPRHDLTRASWPVRAFYAIDQRLPSSREAIGGSGVYGLSEQGRQRFGKFPDIVADDAFVRRHFRPGERMVVEDAVSIVTPPSHLSGLIKIKSRSHYGNYELAAKFPELTQNAGHGNRAALVRLAMNPMLWPHLTVYGFVKIVARIKAKRSWRSRAAFKWERDDTSREAAVSR